MTETATRARPPARVPVSDGRLIAYAEYGDPGGAPCFYFHGTPGSRIWGRSMHDAAARHGVRLIALDRPGLGWSDPQPGRHLLDWPRDVADVADALGIDRFAVMGFSGGGVHALACAKEIADRLTTTVVLAGVAPPDTPGWREGMSGVFKAAHIIGTRRPRGLLPVFALIRWIGEHPRVESVLDRNDDTPDGKILATPEMAAISRENDREMFRQGVRPGVEDYLLNITPWGFRPEDVVGHVEYWQGGEDPNVSAASVRHLARRLPDCVLHERPGEGHMAYVNAADDIFSTVSAAR